MVTMLAKIIALSAEPVSLEKVAMKLAIAINKDNQQKLGSKYS